MPRWRGCAWGLPSILRCQAASWAAIARGRALQQRTMLLHPFFAAPPRRHRSYAIVFDPLTLASAACPSLLELEIQGLALDQPPAPLAHLTRLAITDIEELPDSEPLLRLSAAAPRLEVLSVQLEHSYHSRACAEAAEGHPCLREVRLHAPDKSWLHAMRRLPALSTLAFKSLELRKKDWHEDEREEMEGAAGATARVLRVFGWLSKYERLSHLEVGVSYDDPPTHELLAPSALPSAAGCRP